MFVRFTQQQRISEFANSHTYYISPQTAMVIPYSQDASNKTDTSKLQTFFFFLVFASEQ